MLCRRTAMFHQLLLNKDTYKTLLVAYKYFAEDAISRSAAFEWASHFRHYCNLSTVDCLAVLL